jgi:hypothetical protein
LGLNQCLSSQEVDPDNLIKGGANIYVVCLPLDYR